MLLIHLVISAMLGLAITSPGADLRERFELIAKAAKGKVGAAAQLIDTKETFAMNGDERFPMQSVYKLPIAVAVLQQVERGQLKLDQKVKVTPADFVSKSQHSPIRDAHPLGTALSVSNLMRMMVSESDGTACDVLLRLIGGPSAVTRSLQQLAITNVVVATTEKEMGQDEVVQYRNWATPKACTQLLVILHEGRGLSASSRELLFKLLTETSTGPRRIKRLQPPGTVVAHKTGSSRTVNNLTAATNDAGIITLPDGRRLVVTVFVSDSTADDNTREAVIAKIAKAAWDYWVNQN